MISCELLSDENAEKDDVIEMNWEIKSFSEDEMLFQLTFTDPLKVSYERVDVLEITFIDEKLFISKQGAMI